MSASGSASGWNNGMPGSSQGEDQRLLNPQQLSYGSHFTSPDQSVHSLQGSQPTEQQRLEAAALYCQQLQQQPLRHIFNQCLDNQSGQDFVRYDSAADQAEWQQHRQSELQKYQQQQLQQQQLGSSLHLTWDEPPAKKGPGRPPKGKQGQPCASDVNGIYIATACSISGSAGRLRLVWTAPSVDAFRCPECSEA